MSNIGGLTKPCISIKKKKKKKRGQKNTHLRIRAVRPIFFCLITVFF